MKNEYGWIWDEPDEEQSKLKIALVIDVNEKVITNLQFWSI